MCNNYVVISTEQRDVHDHTNDQQYEDLQSQDAVNPSVMYSRMNQPKHDAVHHHSADECYEEIALS